MKEVLDGRVSFGWGLKMREAGLGDSEREATAVFSLASLFPLTIVDLMEVSQR